ncbi:MAG: M24 family metallopeptidase, partial [Tannerellaceae bacterium]
VGHGIGRNLHEEPEVPNYGKKGYGPLLRNGMCIAIEPMINMGSKNVAFEKDGWTVRTKDRKVSAHFEHTIAIRPGKAEILSSFDYLEEVLGTNAI